MLPLGLGARHVRAEEKPKGLTRRQLLLRGAIAAGALSLVGAVLRFAAFLRHDPAPGRLALSEREEKILTAVLLTMFPGAAGMPPANLDELIPKLDRYLAQSDPDARLLARTVLHLIEEQSVIFHGRRFTSLDAATQAEEIRGWEMTTVHTKKVAFRSFKLICAMMYAEQGDAREAMGWYLGCAPAHLKHLSRTSIGV